MTAVDTSTGRAGATTAGTTTTGRRHHGSGADRNFAELQPRVLLTGVQILLGFLLTPAFSPGFGELDPFRHDV